MKNDNTKNQNECREAFEKWANSQNFDCHSFAGIYRNNRTSEAWCGWQAAYNVNSAPSRMPENEANKNVGDLVDALDAILSMNIKGYTLLERLQFSESGRAVAEKIKPAIARAKALSVIRQQSSVKVDDGVLRRAALRMIASQEMKAIEKDGQVYGNSFEITLAKQALRSSKMPNGSGKED